MNTIEQYLCQWCIERGRIRDIIEKEVEYLNYKILTNPTLLHYVLYIIEKEVEYLNYKILTNPTLLHYVLDIIVKEEVDY